MKETIENIITTVKKFDPAADTALLELAGRIAAENYVGKTVTGGREMLEHSLNVAGILAEYQLDINTVAAGLLHNVLPMPAEEKEKLRARVGDDLFKMIELLASLNVLKFSVDEKEQINQLRRMFIAMARDVRIIMVKLANRLDIIRHIEILPDAERTTFARETLEFFTPLADRLGVSQLKAEIEDHAFKWLYPKEYAELLDNAEAMREQREKSLDLVISELKKLFKSANFSVYITGRTKHMFSMYKKMVRQNILFSELMDLAAVRIIVEKEDECYHVLSILHTNWTPVPDTFDNYILKPKTNGYQSLHTVVVGPGALPVELQIRTWEMHMTAEYGVAAHWRYKEEAGGGRVADEATTWIRRVIDRGAGESDPKSLLSDITLDPFDDSVFVLTPMGKVLSLPSGSTPIDAAYNIHTDVGHRCIGARINSRIAPLDTTLHNGDVVEIITGKVGRPSRDWLSLVKSHAARSKIRSWFKKANRDENISHGRAMLERELEHAGLKRKDIIAKIGLGDSVDTANLKTEEDLFAGIGCGDVSVESVVMRLRKSYREILQQEEEKKPVKAAAPSTSRSKKDVTVEGVSDILVTFSKCCYPLPGDEITGFVSQGRGISVHRKECPNIGEYVKKKERVVPVSWDATQGNLYITELKIHSLDSAGLLNEVLSVISGAKLHVLNMKSKVLKDTTLLTNVRVEVAELKQARNIVARIARIEDVLSVNRMI